MRRDLGANEVSLYRIQVGPELVPHVVAVGDAPEPGLRAKLEVAFAVGERVTLDADMVAYLLARREEARGLGPWVEAHHRPGQPVWLDHQQRRQTREKPDVSSAHKRHEMQKKAPKRRRRGTWKKKRH